VADASISICIPVFNGAAWLRQTMESALAQTRSDFELLVVDNGSSDDSLELARTVATDDGRVRVEHFDETVAAIASHNRCLARARGFLIKFLHQDDTLRADCVEQMASVFEQAPSVGLVFSRREVVLDDPEDPAAQAWIRTYATLHDGFGPLEPVNSGSELLDRWLPTFGDADFENWVAEPSATMLRRDVVERVGGFHPRVRQSFDIDLWLRVMGVSDVGFVDEPLVTFRHHTRSLSAEMSRSHGDWLDRLWLFESLLSSAGFEDRRRMLRSFRRRELLRVVRRQLGRLVRGERDLRPLGAYLRYRLRGR
jgi:glycosyltransferase involved in cell wall biosynthesis